MSVLDLPVEIISLIVDATIPSLSNPNTPSETLSPEDKIIRASRRSILHTLSLTCKAFGGEATRLLYANMIEEDLEMQSGFLEAIQANGHLAALVRCYHFPAVVNRDCSWSTGKDYSYMLRWMRQALLLMVNLKELLVRPVGGWRTETRILPGKPRGKPMPFQLHTLTYWIDTQLEHDREEEVLDFLATQHELQQLRWRHHAKVPRKIRDNMSNRLTWLEAPVESVKSVLPGRAIKRVRCWILTKDTADMGRMPEFRRLDVLSLIPHHLMAKNAHANVDVVDSLCRMCTNPFPALEIVPNFTPTVGGVDREVNVDPHALSIFPGLKVLLIRYTDRSFILDLESGKIYASVRRIAKEYPTIDNVFIYDVSNGRKKAYINWKRGTDGWLVTTF